MSAQPDAIAITLVTLVAVAILALIGFGVVALIAAIFGKKGGTGVGLLLGVLLVFGFLLLVGGALLVPIKMDVMERSHRAEVRQRIEADRSKAEAQMRYEQARHGEATLVHESVVANDTVVESHSDANTDVTSDQPSTDAGQSTDSTSFEVVSGSSSHPSGDGDEDAVATSINGAWTSSESHASHSGENVHPFADQPQIDVSHVDAKDTRKAWDFIEGDRFLPTGFYTTSQAATRGLATRAALEVLTNWPNHHEGQKLDKVFVKADEGNGRIEMAIFVQQLGKELAPINVEETSQQSNPPEGSILLRVKYLNRDTVSTSETGVRTSKGCIEVTASNLNGPAETSLLSARYDQRFWLTDSHPNGWEVAKSGFAANQEAAVEQAQAAAANLLFVHADTQFASSMMYRHPVDVKTQIYRQLLQGQFVEDQFVQELKLPDDKGKVWRCALLINPNPGQLQSAVQTVAAYRAEIQEQRITTSVSTMGFFVVLIGLYAFVNAATKGYYSGALRVVALVTAASVVAWVVTTWR